MRAASSQTNSNSLKIQILEGLNLFTYRIQPAKEWLKSELEVSKNHPDSSNQVGLQQEIDEIERLVKSGQLLTKKATHTQIEEALKNSLSNPPLNKYQNIDWSSRIFLTTFINELELLTG